MSATATLGLVAAMALGSSPSLPGPVAASAVLSPPPPPQKIVRRIIRRHLPPVPRPQAAVPARRGASRPPAAAVQPQPQPQHQPPRPRPEPQRAPDATSNGSR